MNLELVTTEAILKEIESRFTHYIFIGVMPLDDDSEKRITRYSGNYIVSMGLCAKLMAKIHERQERDIEPLNDEDM